MGFDVYLLNRGIRSQSITGTTLLRANITNLHEIYQILKPHRFDVVVNWIAYTTDDVRRDLELFRGKTKQYIFISSASVYQKPPRCPIITESTPLANPYWQYSRNKIQCELLLNSFYRDQKFPVTIVRPSQTYDTIIPAAIGGGIEYTVVDRIRKGKKIIVHGDGSSLWIVTHSEDFARGFVGLLGNQHAVGHAFHITSDEILTWDQIHHTIADAVDAEADIVHIPSDVLARYDEELRGTLLGDTSASVIFDNFKIRQFVPHFRPTIPFSQGIRRTLEWFHEDPTRQIVKKETQDWIDMMIHKFQGVFPSY